MKALVTGASGFIGSTLIEELGTLGFEVSALMRSRSSPKNLEGMKFSRVEGDMSDFASLKKAVRDVDYVFHLAGMAVARNREEFFECNTRGTQRLAQAVAEARPGLARFVFVSSLAAGGPARSLDPRTEDQEDEPVSAYGESKLQAEKELLHYKDTYPVSIVRPPLVYGPKDKATFLFVQTVSRNLMPIMKATSKEGHKYYSSIHVRDLCRGIVQSALAPREKLSSGEVFYMTDDSVITYEGMFRTIADHLNRDPLRIPVHPALMKFAAMSLTSIGKLTRRTFALNSDKINELLPDYWICSNQKAKRLLGFAPEFNPVSGWSHAIDWYKKQQWI